MRKKNGQNNMSKFKAWSSGQIWGPKNGWPHTKDLGPARPPLVELYRECAEIEPGQISRCLGLTIGDKIELE